MAVQIILNKRHKAALAKKLAGEQAGGDVQLGPQYKAGYGPGRTVSDASDLSDGDGKPFGSISLEDGTDIVDMEDKRIVTKLYNLLRDNRLKKQNYLNLAAFLVFTALYLVVLYLQLTTYQTFLVTSSFTNLLPQDGSGGVASTVTSSSDIYTYLNETLIQPLWADPVCGDGICDKPIEFAGFGRFGCTPDCGSMPATDVTITFQTAFDNAKDEKDSSWNLCTTYPDSLCWYEEPQTFSDLTATLTTTLSLPNGTWEMVLTSANRGVQGNVKTQLPSGAASPGSDGYEVLTSWGGCVPDNQSDVVRCRSICAQSALCAVEACSNLDNSTVPDIFIDCTNICNQNATLLDGYQNITCLQAISAARVDSTSFLGVGLFNCTLDPVYLAAHPVEVALGNATQAPTPTPSTANSTGIVGGSSRKILQTSVDPTSGNATLLYWNKFGSTDAQRYRTLATALSRALHTWAIDSCLCPYSFKPSATGPPMLGFFCAYLGGPPTFHWCAYTDPKTGQNLTSANFTELNAVLSSRYGPSSGFNISQAEQDQFITILLNAIDASIGFGYGATDALNLEARLHYTDTAVVQLAGDNCNKPSVVLPWALNVHQATNVSAGDSIQWTWSDGLPHALISLDRPENESIFTGFGSGRQILSSETLCTPQNILAVEDGTFTQDPVPCVVPATNAGNQANIFSYTKYFNNTGSFAYTDTRYASKMTGIVIVSDYEVEVANNATTAPIAYKCAPGCKIGSLNNGLCDSACNNFACRFDGGDCSCPNTAAATPPSSAGGATSSSESTSATCSCPANQIQGPDGSCCQAQILGDLLTLPFDIIIDNMNSDSLFDPANYTRTRYATNHNRIIGGLFLYQTRLEADLCKHNRFPSLAIYCLGGGHSTAPFGADPLFLPTSTLYNPGLNLPDYYLANELSPLGTPYGFFPRHTKGEKAGFPIVLDINLDQNGAQERLQYLSDGLFLDNATDVLTVKLVTYNGVERQFVDMSLYFTFQPEGKITVNYDVSGVRVQYYISSVDYFRACLEILVALAVLYNIYTEIAEMIQVQRETGSVINYFASLYNYVDIISLCLMLTAIVIWIVFVANKAQPFHAVARYDIYEDLLASARFFGLAADTQFDQFVQMVANVNSLVVYRSVYAAINGLNIFFIIVRIFKLFDFQPKMGIITRSLTLAGPELLSFFVLWSILFVGFAFMGHMVFGRTVETFRTLQWSLTALFLMILGDNSAEYQLMQLTGWELAASQLFFYSFQIAMVFIIMQFLVAIAVDAFAEIKERTPENAPGMVEDLLAIAKEKIERITHKRYSDRAIMRMLQRWEGPALKKTAHEEETHNALQRALSGEVQGEVYEKKRVLKLDKDEVDKEKLETIFGRRATIQAHEVTPEIERIADQILTEFGEEVIKRVKKRRVRSVKQEPTMKEDLKLLKSEVKMLRALVAELTNVLHQRFDDVKQDMAHAGISRSLILEEDGHANGSGHGANGGF